MLIFVLAGALAASAAVDAAGRIQLDVHFDCSLNAPVAALQEAGLVAPSSVKAGSLCVVEGWAAPAALPRIAATTGVTRVSAPSYVQRIRPRALRPVLRAPLRAPVARQGASGGIDANGISIMRAGQFLTQTGVNGAGVTVGVQSTGVVSLSNIQALGELPAVTVLFPAGSTTPVSGDEGTMLMEEIHAVAPGANLMYCGPSTFVDYISCLSQMIAAGASIVMDDTSFVGDGVMSQNNDQTSAVSALLAQNPATLMLSAAGNNDGTYWQGNYTPVSAATTSLPTLSCPYGAAIPDTYVATFGSATSETLTVTGSDVAFPLLLAWADPPTQLTSQFDVYWFASGSNTPMGCMSTSGASSDQVQTQLTLQSGVYTVVVASADATAAGKFLKLWAGGDGLTTFSVATSGGLLSPQAMATGVLTVGAVNGSDGIGNNIEPFSSTGPLSVVFPAAAQLQAPSLVAPDGIYVDAAGTYFESELFPDGNFYGTSASVPNAAAVAALLRSAFPALSVSQITDSLQSGATVLGAAAPDDVFGYGRVDALGALGTVPTPTITALTDASSSGSASSATQPFTVTGTGALHFTVSSSNAALVPSSVVTAGMPGVTLSAGCGTSTLNCTLLVTPVLGQSGMATLTINAQDGANRPASAQLVFTATDPAPAPTGSGSGSGSGSGGSGSGVSTGGSYGGSGGGGGALQWWVLLGLALALGSKVQGQFQQARERLQRMHLDAINPRLRFARQARGVVVGR